MPDAAPTSKPPCRREDAEAVLRRLRGAGHVAYFAGGCVRDLLLGKEPKDWDVATDAPPKRVRELFTNTQAVGQAFGVILVRHRGSTVEVATFRAEGKYLDGRHPSEVRFTTAEEDARRRDFTINGLFLDPLKPGALEEQVIDYVGGREDLKAKVLRAIGNPDERFVEDHLRLLRAIRFAARFSFGIEEETDQAIRRHAGHLVRISPERTADELRTMLTPPTRGAAWGLLSDYGLDGVIFRFLQLPWPFDSDVVLQGRGRFVEKVAPGRHIPFGLAIGAATSEAALWRMPRSVGVRELLDKPIVTRMVKAVRQALRVSNDEAEQMAGTLEGLSPLLRDEPPGVATLKRFLARPTAPHSRALLEALDGALDPGRRAWLMEKFGELETTDYAPPPLVTGDDLAAAGLAPGPVFKRVLDAAYDAQLEGRVGTKEDALAVALRLARESEK